jgi:hypothetical protein
MQPAGLWPSNKELKLTKPGTIGASQLNSSVGRTAAGGARLALPNENDRLNDGGFRPWGMLSWAAWLPELANAFVVILTVLLVVASLVRRYSDAELGDNIVDTYEAAAWAALTTYVIAAIGIACACVAWFAAQAKLRRRLALFQVLLLLLCVGTAAYQQHRLAARVARLQDAPRGEVP